MVVLGVACAVAYSFSEKSPSASIEECKKHCAPGKGVIERQGFNAGPDWRPTSHNAVCACK